MIDMEAKQNEDFTSFAKFEGCGQARGMNDWAVPWSDLMMVMFVLFVVLFVYSTTHKDVKVLFSQQAADDAQATSALDPLIGLIGQIASRADSRGSNEIIRMADHQVLYRSRENGVSVIRDGQHRIRVTMRGNLFFDAGSGALKPESVQYLAEVAEVVKLSVGGVHVMGFSSQDEASGPESFSISTQRASDVAALLISQFNIAPKRVTITGRGAYMPEVPGTTESNQAMNRRVEIIITNDF